ncbi:MAG: hypothetical protein ACLQVM_24360 [Terriglobia bacterium]
MRLSLAEQAAEKLFETVILSEAKNLALCIFKKIRRARSFATLRMTTVELFSAACKALLRPLGGSAFYFLFGERYAV